MFEHVKSPVKDHPLRRWVRYVALAIWVILLFILLALVANLFNSSVSFIYSRRALMSQPFIYNADLPEELFVDPDDQFRQTMVDTFQDLEILERSITILPSGGNLQVNFSLVIPKDDPAVPQITEEWAGRQALFTELMFGVFQANRSPLVEQNFEIARWEVNPRSEVIALTLTAIFSDVGNRADISFRANQGDPIQPEVDKLLVDLGDSALIRMQPVPDDKNSRRATIVRRFPEELPAFNLAVQRTGAENEAETAQPLGMSRRAFLRRVSALLDNRSPLSELLFASTKALPLLIFLWLARRSANTDPRVQALVDLTSGLLVFHFSLYLTQGLVNWLNDVSWVAQWEEELERFAWHLDPVFFVSLTTGFWRLQIILLGLFIPSLWLMRRREDSGSAGRQWNWSAIISVFLVLIVLGSMVAAVIRLPADIVYPCTDALELIFVPQEAPPQADRSMPPIFALLTCGIPVGVWAVIGVGLFVLVLRWALGALLRAATGENHPLLAWAGTALLGLGILYRESKSLSPTASAYEGAVWLIYAVSLGTFLLWSFARFVFSFYRRMGMEWTPRPSAKLWLFLATVILAVPAGFIFGNRPAEEWEFLSIAFYVDDLLVFVWVGGVLCLLYKDGESDLMLEASTHIYGPLALGALMFNPLARWLYIPITFLLGWVALRWLLATGHVWGSIENQFKQMSRVRSRLIAHGSLVRILDHTYSQYRKDRIDKLAKGELNPRKFKSALDTWELDHRTTSHNPVPKLDQELSKHPLAFGPKSTAWENGLHGAQWAALLALPWYIIYIVAFLRGTSFSSSYPLLDFLIDLLIIFSRWASIGFVLGYFFPYLRGDSGLEKGLWLSLVVIVTSLPLYFLFNDNAIEWRSTLIWALQVLTQCILLGLIAFDYATVRDERRGFQLLLELHGMRSLGLWTATLIAAIGTSAVTLLSTQAVSFFSLIVKALFPDFAADFSSTP
jgi:hypothetical protein